MLMAEAFAFVGFRNTYNEKLESSLTISEPRPMGEHIMSLILAVSNIRIIILVLLFILEQCEVGFSYMPCCNCVGWQQGGGWCGSGNNSVTPAVEEVKAADEEAGSTDGDFEATEMATTNDTHEV